MDKKPSVFQKRVGQELINLKAAGLSVTSGEKEGIYRWEAILLVDENLPLGQDLKKMRGLDPRIDGILIGMSQAYS